MFAHKDVETICGAIKSRNTGYSDTYQLNIKHVDLTACFVGGIENRTLMMILTSISAAGAEGMSLCLNGNGMSSREAALIAEHLSSNSNLKELDLSDNRFDDADAEVLANALSGNTNLHVLSVDDNQIKKNGMLAFLRAVFDVSSLDLCASSNHTCQVNGLEQDISYLNNSTSVDWTRLIKIFAMLALSSKDSLINTALLKGVPTQLIPMLLDAAGYDVDKEGSPELTDLYLKLTNTKRNQRHDAWDNLGNTKTLNCVYELMRGWVVSLIFA